MRHISKVVSIAFFISAILISNSLFGQDEQLPNPLTLQQALALSERHPDIEVAAAEHARIVADYHVTKARYGFNVDIVSHLYAIEPSEVAPVDDKEDYSAGLVIRKRLYDFGRTRYLTESKQAEIQRFEIELARTEVLHKLAVMRRFFEVIYADLRYTRDNEAMAVAYVQYDKAKDRKDLGKVSDIDLLETQSVYHESRLARFRSQGEQRAARTRLAVLLNRPQQIPADLIPPEARLDKWALPDLETLLTKADNNNSQLRALRAQLESARSELIAARRQRRPVLEGGVEAWSYSRELSGDDQMRAGVTLQVPLWQGGRVGADIQRAQANFQYWQGRLEQARMQVRQAVTDIWVSLENLRIQREQTQVQMDYRDLYLDRSRAMYDLEIVTDLGDAMVLTSDARLRAAEAHLGSLLAWANLRALVGESINLEEMAK